MAGETPAFGNGGRNTEEEHCVALENRELATLTGERGATQSPRFNPGATTSELRGFELQLNLCLYVLSLGFKQVPNSKSCFEDLQCSKY